MNLPYIQSELFRELVSMETLLKPEWKMRITRDTEDCLIIRVWKRPFRWKDVDCHQECIDTRTIKTADQITAEINRIWNEIPVECKKDDILK